MSVGSTDDGKVVKLISKDGGKTWDNQEIELPRAEGFETNVSEITAFHNGEIIVFYFQSKDSEEQLKYAKIDNSGTVTDLNINGTNVVLRDFKMSDNGDIFYINMNTVVQVDGKTLEEKNTFEVGDSPLEYVLMGEQLIINEQDDIVCYDITNGEKKGNVEALKKEMIDNKGNDSKTFLDSNSKDKVYYRSNLGLFEYDIKTDKTKKLVDGAISYFGTLQETGKVKSLIEKEDCDFLVLFNEYVGSVLKCVLINYHYDKEISAFPDNQITVYSLIENDTIRKAVGYYAKNHRDVYVKYETGMAEGMGITESDAIKTLNTEIANGKGPDIVVLDDLNTDSYIKDGLLDDLSDVVDSNDELFSNVSEALKTDGKIYQYPLNLAFPTIAGNKDKVEKVKDLDSLLAVTKELKDESKDKITPNIKSAQELFYKLYYLYGNDWITEDEKINEESLTNYMNKVKEIYTITDERAKEVDGQAGLDLDETSSENAPTEQEELVNMKKSLTKNLLAEYLYTGEKVSIGYGAFADLSELDGVVGLMDSNKDATYKVMNRNDEKVFIPVNCIGINAKSKNKDTAKDFLKELLTEKAQIEINRYRGLSVNKNAITNTPNSLKENAQLDESTNHYVYSIGDIKLVLANEDDVNKLISKIEELNVPAKLNRKLLMEAGKQFEAFQKGEISVDDAVKEVVKNLDLYLSE